jgi:hypothetical protein
VNAFCEHHKDHIRFGYRCFDRILLNCLIQPFQQPERVVGFFSTYRNLYPVCRKVLRDIAQQFQGWVVNRAKKWRIRSWRLQRAGAMNLSNPIFAKPSLIRSWPSSKLANPPLS